MKNIKDTKRLTAGVIVAQGVHSLNDPRFLVPFRARQVARREAEEKAAKFQRDKFLKVFEGVRKLREKRGHENGHRFENCTKDKCGAYLQ